MANYFECLVRQNYRMGRMPWGVRPGMRCR